METLVFIVLIVIGITVSGGVLFFQGGPGIVGVCGAAIPLVCGLPAALIAFLHPTFKTRFQGIQRSIFSALLPILFASMVLIVLMYDQNPKVMFKRLLSDPIPEGVSNIRSYDDSGGFDVEYGLAFEATSDSIDYLIAKNGFEAVTDEFRLNRLDAPFEHFPDINPNQDWLYYSKHDPEHENVWFLWVNTDKSLVLFKFIGF